MKNLDKDSQLSLAKPLALVRSLVTEINIALEAMANLELAAFEKSVARQEILVWQIGVTLNDAAIASRIVGEYPVANKDEGLRLKVGQAFQVLLRATEIYGLTIRHCSASGRLMLSAVDSSIGRLQEASGAGRDHRTWSGQM